MLILVNILNFKSQVNLTFLVIMWVANIGAALTKANEFKSHKSVIRLTEVRIGSSPIAHNMMNDDFFNLEVMI